MHCVKCLRLCSTVNHIRIVQYSPAVGSTAADAAAAVSSIETHSNEESERNVLNRENDEEK